MEPFFKRLKRDPIIVSDGAIGSVLIGSNLPKTRCPEEHNISNLEILEDIALQYLQAGAEIIQTNTFGGSPLKLSDYSLDNKTEEINTNAVKAVKNAIKGKAYISGSCGPSGKILKPYGSLDPEDLYESYYRQINILVNSGVDIICVETMTDLSEAQSAIKAAKDISPSIPVMATMTFDKTPRGFFTIMGTDIKTASKGLEEAGADVIGSNCGNGIDNMVLIAEEFSKITDLPVIIQSNAGLPVIKDGKIIYQEGPDFMAERIKRLKDLNISIIGGCCGTTPSHIKAFREAVDSLN
ncbi:MAG: homocysteine S-methyltransferase family protein [Acidobacteriota bacterium]